MLILQMTGLSGSGKSTLAALLKSKLSEKGISAEVIDGDVYRKTINKELGFSSADRKENIRRLGKIADDFKRKGIVAIIAAINPFEDIRHELKENLEAKIIWINCSLELLIKRDTKGLYKRALLPDDDPEKIWNLTGINDTYELPADADLIINTGNTSIETSVQILFKYVQNNLDCPSS